MCSPPTAACRRVDDQTNKFFDVVQNDHVRPVDDRVMPFLKAEDNSMEVFPMVNNFDGTEWVEGITDFLNNPEGARAFPPAGGNVSFVGSLSRADGGF